MDQKERMLAGLPYKAWLDGLSEEREACQRLIYEFNTTNRGNGERSFPLF